MGCASVILNEALADIRRLYLETPPIIYFVEENPIYIDRMMVIMEAASRAQFEAVSGVLTLTEVLVHPLKTNNKPLAAQYRKILVNSRDFRLIPITIPISEVAADLRARYALRSPDALHLATAIHAECDAFLTNDIALKRVSEIRVLVLDDLTIDDDEAPNA